VEKRGLREEEEKRGENLRIEKETKRETIYVDFYKWMVLASLTPRTVVEGSIFLFFLFFSSSFLFNE
jgi:hypothetical protein